MGKSVQIEKIRPLLYIELEIWYSRSGIVFSFRALLAHKIM